MAGGSVHADDETPSTIALSLGITTPYNHDSSIPSTPGEDTYFTPRKAMASFDHLVALANYQERLEGTRRVVWRDKGEPAVDVETPGGCIEHAARGGFRSGSLAFGIRACVNLVFALLHIHSVPKHMKVRYHARYLRPPQCRASRDFGMAEVWEIIVGYSNQLIPVTSEGPAELVLTSTGRTVTIAINGNWQTI
ncbi:hypothetical protein P691DRAFT_785817 [Macrolepiota fuliginosa MF-IS2]|uniref:Uncharacterized protein n=1 Tax=Macrolepiota fuliginosa MF-IS2 TaxID=1400762 RepID=A0A9P6BYC8_9AGAR|nr:hypothetical protein P691DRAFT_785817 [Macrolepiota fuliginosa MF-IS2]